MKTAVCCIVKYENKYLKEWVDYHLKLGFDQIFIYDNNNPDGEEILPALRDYKEIKIFDCRGKTSYQVTAYTNCYNTYGKQFDWIAFIDVDEFITFSEESGIRTIKEFLERFDENVEIIHLNWMCYGDSGIVELEDNYSVLERFTIPIDYDNKVQYDFPENNHVKSIIRGGMDIKDRTIGVHTPKDYDYYVVDARGERCENDYFKPYEYSVAYVRHFVTKTIFEWLIKLSRGRGDTSSRALQYPIDRFFVYNERTAEKEKIISHYNLFKECIEQSMSTRLVVSQADDYYKKYNDVINSKTYKLANKITKIKRALGIKKKRKSQ